MNKKNTGLFFGSFNPIHIGHMAIANYFAEFSKLDEIWFIVSPHNPLKEKSTLLNDYKRLELVRLAIDDDKRFKASDIEFSLPQPSYTTNTLAYLNEKYNNKKFSLIMGADNIKTIHKWKNYQYLLDNYKIYVYPRPGYSFDMPKNADIEIINAPVMEISSSFIRNAVKDGKDIRFYLPPSVYDYIYDMNLFK